MEGCVFFLWEIKKKERRLNGMEGSVKEKEERKRKKTSMIWVLC